VASILWSQLLPRNPQMTPSPSWWPLYSWLWAQVSTV
jgi:hypothetical protein